MKDRVPVDELKGVRVLTLFPDGDDQVIPIDWLEGLGLKVTVAGDVRAAEDILDKGAIDLALIAHDVSGGETGVDGIGILRALRDRANPAGVILVAKRAAIEDAVVSMQLGALDFLCQPVDMEALELAIRRAVTAHVLARLKGRAGRGDGHSCAGLEGVDPYRIITCSPRVEKILSQAASVAKSKAPVLILGESGTGKELLARYIHRQSQRSGPFVAVNCAALPETLLESELFGHEKGAFSGAFARKPGKFELAAGGTLLLDELTEMGLPLQAKLLRVIQEGEVDRLGGTGPVKIDARILAASNRDVKSAVSSGRLREDLYFRLNVIMFRFPPLRERREDIALLAGHFLDIFSREYGKYGLKFASDVIETIKEMDWPGNTRELRNAMERAVLLAEGECVTMGDILGDDFSGAAASEELDVCVDVPGDGKVVSLNELERNMITRALSKTSGNRTHAAKLLGISVRTLRNKLSEYRQMGIVL